MTGPTTIDLAATRWRLTTPECLIAKPTSTARAGRLSSIRPGAGRRDWCDTPHAGYVVSGTITYAFEDGREPVAVGPGGAFVLPAAPRHRGANQGSETARL